MDQGIFISFEGAEGVGKSTQLGLLQEALVASGEKVYTTREPGGTPLGENLRKFLKHDEMSALTELFLIQASRAEHLASEIRPRLKQGQIILCDRFTDSTLVYQGVLRGLPLDDVQTANTLATQGLKPDWTICLDLPEEKLPQRLASKDSQDRFDREELAFHEKILASFRELAKKDTRIQLYAADTERDALHREILSEFHRRFWQHA